MRGSVCGRGVDMGVVDIPGRVDVVTARDDARREVDERLAGLHTLIIHMVYAHPHWTRWGPSRNVFVTVSGGRPSPPVALSSSKTV